MSSSISQIDLISKAYRIGVCEKNRMRPLYYHEWIFDRDEVLRQKSEHEAKDPDHDFLIEESDIALYEFEWENLRDEHDGSVRASVRESRIPLPTKDPEGALRTRIRTLIGHSEFKIRRSMPSRPPLMR